MKNLHLLHLVLLLTFGVGVCGVRAERPTTGAVQSRMNGKLKVVAMAEEDCFYTGKPYNKDLGGYVFAYRTYSPTLSRWTSADPSGFPDGANQHIYAPSPTSELDPAGLLKWNTLTATTGIWSPYLYQTPNFVGYQVTYNIYTILANDGITSVKLYEYAGGLPAPLAANPGYNCAGYVFANSNFWINPFPGDPSFENILKADGYRKITGSDTAKAKVVLWGNEHIAFASQNDGTNVTEVTGKRGLELGPLTSTISDQVQGSSPTSYWE